MLRTKGIVARNGVCHPHRDACLGKLLQRVAAEEPVGRIDLGALGTRFEYRFDCFEDSTAGVDEVIEKDGAQAGDALTVHTHDLGVTGTFAVLVDDHQGYSEPASDAPYAGGAADVGRDSNKCAEVPAVSQ